MSAIGLDVEGQLELYRPELTGYAYRMLGSSFEAEDAVHLRPRYGSLERRYDPDNVLHLNHNIRPA